MLFLNSFLIEIFRRFVTSNNDLFTKTKLKTKNQDNSNSFYVNFY